MSIYPFDPIAQYPELLPMLAALTLIAFAVGVLAGGRLRPSSGPVTYRTCRTCRALERTIERLEGELTDARGYALHLIDDPDFLLVERMHRRLPVGRWRVRG